MGIRHRATSITTTAVTALILLGVHASATAADCKGMEKAACEKSTAQCSWVDTYTRKDGVKVSGHCRKKSGKSSGGSKS